MKIGIYYYLIADILTKVLQKCSLNGPLPTVCILCKSLNLIGCHGIRNTKFAKKYSKIFSSEAIRGMKLKLCRNVHNISLYKNYVFYCRCSCAFVAMATYNFRRLIMGKRESRPLYLSHCRYFVRIFQKSESRSLLLSQCRYMYFDRTFFINVC